MSFTHVACAAVDPAPHLWLPTPGWPGHAARARRGALLPAACGSARDDGLPPGPPAWGSLPSPQPGPPARIPALCPRRGRPATAAARLPCHCSIRRTGICPPPTQGGVSEHEQQPGRSLRSCVSCSPAPAVAAARHGWLMRTHVRSSKPPSGIKMPCALCRAPRCCTAAALFPSCPLWQLWCWMSGEYSRGCGCAI